MAYPKEIKEIVDKIPKEYHKSIQIIISYYFELGVSSVQEMLSNIVSIEPKKIDEYGVYHEDNLEGG